MTLSIVDQALKDSIVKPEESDYKSNVLQMFLEGLHQRDGSHLLDLGLNLEDITGFPTLVIISMRYRLKSVLLTDKPSSAI